MLNDQSETIIDDGKFIVPSKSLENFFSKDILRRIRYI